MIVECYEKNRIGKWRTIFFNVYIDSLKCTTMYEMKRVFGCAVEKIDFDRIDFVELVLVKSELNIK